MKNEAEIEGVIKYQLNFLERPLAMDAEILRQLNEARKQMLDEGLIGADENRYGGLGFGNLSLRCNTTQCSRFFISGSQTGHLQTLSESDLAYVTGCDNRHNTVNAEGQCKPSSESMTHGVIYQSCLAINAVIHVHSPDIWYHSAALGLPDTAGDIAYGTPEMAASVSALVTRHSRHELPLVFTMRGHVDGVVAGGENLRQCARALHQFRVRAQELN